MMRTLDTSGLWDQYCLIAVGLIWGGRSLPLGQTVLEQGSATVGFEHYAPGLETTLRLLPPGGQVMLLAERGFAPGALIRWFQAHRWSWAIRAKADLNRTRSKGDMVAVATLLPPPGEAYLFPQVTILQDIQCQLATAHLALAGEPWAVISNVPPSLQTVEVYGQRFGGIEPHFKDYKSAAFELIRSHLREAQALNCLFMLLATAMLIATAVAVVVVREGRRKMLDWTDQRGLSFLQLGLREIKRLCYQHLPLPRFATLPRKSPPPAAASLKKRAQLETRIEFSRISAFST